MNKEIIDLIMNGKDFVMEQAPEVVQQYLNIQTIDHLGWAIVLLILSIVSFKFSRYAFLEVEEGRWDDHFWTLIGSLIAIFITIGVVCNTVTAIEIKTNPKGYLLQEVLRKK